MNWLLCWLVILFIVIIIYVCWTEEGFETQELDPEFVKSYQTFIAFYNPFMVNWQKSIVTSMNLDAPPQPALTSPTQVPSGGSAPAYTQDQMNQYIDGIIQTQHNPFPYITDPLPDLIDQTTFSKIAKKIPNDPKPFMNALKWMNDALEKSHSSLGQMQTSEGFTFTEGFDTDMCQQIIQCNQEQDAKQQQQQAEQQQKIRISFDKFNNNSELKQAMTQNQVLVKKSQDIQNQAQSGELLNNMPTSTKTSGSSSNGAVPGITPADTSYSPMPGKSLSELQQEDPQKYQEYQQDHKSLFSLKQSLDQINRNLR